jgi:hypothetical protein
MGFETKVALLRWHGCQSSPIEPQSAISSSPHSVSALVIDRPSSDLSSTGISIDFSHLDDQGDQDGLFRPSHFIGRSMGV